MVKKVDTPEDFTKLLADNKDKLIVVDFFATWCGPCRMIAPEIEKMEKEFADVLFVKVDVDENDEVAANCEIEAMPTFAFFKNGSEVKSLRITGANEAKIRETVTANK